MTDILKIFFMNFINDLDNLLIITTVIRKYGYTVKTLFIYIVVCLTLSRTLYVLVIHSLVDFPSLRFVTGMIILSLAVRLAWSIEKDKRVKIIPNISIFQMMLIVMATDFSICLDSVIITSELSSNPSFIAIGIGLSVSTLFILYRSFTDLLGNTSWIQVIASGLIAHMAILSIVKDPITKTPLVFIEKYLEIHMNNWINVFALDVAIIIMIMGVLRRMQNRSSL
ncbi:TerC family protein [Niallia sp. Krafla_26]|uniref:TerC family protein n=1 Tax=Niallia sp. Krafla_26 TaxID=3064703 RepID=UPI003D175B68